MTFLSNLKAKVVGDVDDILASFHKTVDRLNVRADLHAAEAEAHSFTAQLHTALSAKEAAAAARAGAIASKIKALVS